MVSRSELAVAANRHRWLSGAHRVPLSLCAGLFGLSGLRTPDFHADALRRRCLAPGSAESTRALQPVESAPATQNCGSQQNAGHRRGALAHVGRGRHPRAHSGAASRLPIPRAPAVERFGRAAPHHGEARRPPRPNGHGCMPSLARSRSSHRVASLPALRVGCLVSIWGMSPRNELPRTQPAATPK